MTEPQKTIDELLCQLQHTMIKAEMWQSEPPSSAALQSREPFAVDTLSLAQWLQFIFIPRFQGMLADGAPLPTKLAIAPYAEQVWTSSSEQSNEVLAVIRAIDRHFVQG